MGGRGAGATINWGNSGNGIWDGGNASWMTVVADFNPNAGHREVNPKQTMHDFARVSAEKYDNEVEVLAIVDNEGYVTHASKGQEGRCYITDEMMDDIRGHNVTHYHNRIQKTDAQRAVQEADERAYGQLLRAKRDFDRACADIAEIENRRNINSKTLRMATGNTGLGSFMQRTDVPDSVKQKVLAAQSQLDADEHAWRLAYRRKEAAARRIQERADAYEQKAKSGRATRYMKPNEVQLPPQKSPMQDETGFIGGCHSVADISSSLLSKDIPSFSASCEEGTYTIAPSQHATKEDIEAAQREIRRLWDPRSTAPETKKFQRQLRVIDRKTGVEGGQKGWPKQQRRAISFNRQMAFIWEQQKAILNKHNINAHFDANPDYKPIYTDN